MKRRDFLKHAGQAGVFGMLSPTGVSAMGFRARDAVERHGVKRNPYDGVNWDACTHVQSLSHVHTYWGDEERIRERVMALYDRGIRHLAISNYEPAHPYYPLHEWLPGLPEDLLSSPNAEHRFMTDTPLHFNSLGSFLKSGKPRGETPRGIRVPWRDAFAAALAELQYPDGGGVTVNHPAWSGLRLPTVAAMCAFDPCVLGIEVYNNTCEDATSTPLRGWGDAYWQALLSQGLIVRGLFAVDHGHAAGRGRNVLLLPELTERAALQAYRQGAFYCSLEGTTRLLRMEYRQPVLRVETDNGQTIRFVTHVGTVQEISGSVADYIVQGDEVFVRAEIDGPDGELVFTQPILFDRVAPSVPGYTGALIGWDGDTGNRTALSVRGVSGRLTSPYDRDAGRSWSLGTNHEAGSTDGTFGSAIPGAATGIGAYGVRMSVPGDTDRIHVEVINNTGWDLQLDRVSFDYTPAWDSSPRTVSMEYAEGALNVPESMQIQRATEIPRTGARSDYNDFDWSLADLPDRTLSPGRHAVFALICADAESPNTNGWFDNVAVSGTILSDVDPLVV